MIVLFYDIVSLNNYGYQVNGQLKAAKIAVKTHSSFNDQAYTHIYMKCHNWLAEYLRKIVKKYEELLVHLSTGFNR